MRTIYVLIIFFCFNAFLFSQNFFPININNRYQYKETYTHSTPYYNNYIITEDTLYDGKVFYKFGYKYLHYDTLENKLYILQATGINLAVDFTAPVDSAVDLNFDGGTTKYVSLGTYYENVFGKNRLCYKMQYYHEGSPGLFYYQEGREYYFADSIGLYLEHYYSYSYESGGSDHREELYAAKIDSIQYSLFSFDINLISDVEDTPINYFPLKIRAGTSVSDFSFVDTIYTDFYVYRNDTLVCNKQFPFNGIILTANVDLDSAILKAGDLIKFRCILKDSTILENSYFSPDSGYYSFKVLAPVMTGVENTNQSTEFSFGAFPNPFNSSTKISFQLLHQNAVNIEIYNILGKKVRTIINNKLLPGKYSYIWDSKNDAGEMLPSGIYFVRFNSTVLSKTLKIVLLK